MAIVYQVYSNTTLVKVKLKNTKPIQTALEFKYNTC